MCMKQLKIRFFTHSALVLLMLLKIKEKLCGLCASSGAPLSGISDMLQRVRDKGFVMNKYPFSGFC
jgi:hypothetical protein